MGANPPALQGQGVINHQTLGPVRIKKVEAEEPYSTMELHCSVEEEQIYKQWEDKVKQIAQPEMSDIVLLPLKSQYENLGICGSSGIIKATYEYFPIVLKVEIENRQKLNQKFEEIQIWYLMYFILQAGNKFESLKEKIGDVNPQNIFLNQGEVRMVSTRSIPTQTDNFKKFVQNKQKTVYLAPEQLNEDALTLGDYPKNVDPCRAEVFSIGTIILALGNLKLVHDIYKENKIDTNKLKEYLINFKSRYSTRIYNIVQDMLEIDPSNRRSCSDIFKKVKIFENQIFDLEPVQNWKI